MATSDDGSKIHDLDPPQLISEIRITGHSTGSNETEYGEGALDVHETVPRTDATGILALSDSSVENGTISSRGNEPPSIESKVSPLPFIVSSGDMESPIADSDAINTKDNNTPSSGLEDCKTDVVDIASSQKARTDSGIPDVQLPLLSLPIDSLHCVASFLSLTEWSALGSCNRAACRVFREVARRVRMHGFRCATEVVTAWKLGQHADAKELTALYIQNGVPIYPQSLGHSYQTLVWKMTIEAREMQIVADQREGGSDHATRVSQSRVDRFFTERSALRAHEEYSKRMSYLEEKCLFALDQEDSIDANGRSIDHRRAPLARDEQIVRRGPNFARREAGPIRVPNVHPSDSLSTGTQTTSRVSVSLRPRCPKPTVKIHQHLFDQYLLSRPCVNDQDGEMRTSPISLSADFFHPHIGRASGPSPAPKTHFARESQRFVAADETESLRNQQQLSIGYAPFQEEIDPIQVDLVSPPSRSSTQCHASSARGFTYDEFEQDRDLSDSDSIEPAPAPEQPPRSILDDVDLEVYSVSTVGPKWKVDAEDGTCEIKSHLRTRFAAYQRRLESLLAHNDSSGFEECILDFWDEFLPLTAGIQYFDRHTAVPRISCLHKFLTKPCPKAVGIVQCEIERIKINSKKKGVNMKGRFFPVYEYRLFIRHRPPESTESGEGDSSPQRRDTVLIAAKNRGRKHVDASGVIPISSSAKKGVNNYFLYMPQQADVDAHFNSVNELDDPVKNNPNGASQDPVADGGAVLLGRLQSNIIGTEFQIFTPSICKRPARKTGTQSNNSVLSSDDEDVGYDSGMSSDNASSNSRRRNRFSRRMSLRRSNVPTGDQPTPIEEEITANSDRRIKRTGSWPVLSYTRSSRTSRRAIANTAVVNDSQQYQTILCEEEDGAITYTANLLGNRPRIMDVCIPRVSPDGLAGAEWKRYLESCDDTNEAVCGNRMIHRFKQLQQRLENHEQNNNEETNTSIEDGYVPPDDFGLLALQNRPPWWNIELGAFVLNFGGRVSVASVKNFQLCDRTDHDNIMLQFGRIHGRHSFTMDFKYPLTAVQAFAIAISSLQSKISFG